MILFMDNMQIEVEKREMKGGKKIELTPNRT